LRFLREVVAEVEARRFASLRETLGHAREERHFRRIPVPATARMYQLEFDGLHGGSTSNTANCRSLRPPPPAPGKLSALSQALANDYETFERAFRTCADNRSELMPIKNRRKFMTEHDRTDHGVRLRIVAGGYTIGTKPAPVVPAGAANPSGTGPRRSF
jgi:hypothetical protein